MLHFLYEKQNSIVFNESTDRHKEIYSFAVLMLLTSDVDIGDMYRMLFPSDQPLKAPFNLNNSPPRDLLTIGHKKVTN